MFAVFGRLRGLFSRYADRHASLSKPGHALPDFEGEPLGYIDSVDVHRNRLWFEGWTRAESLTVSWSGGQITQRPNILRNDVAEALGLEPDLGFIIEVPVSTGPYDLTLRWQKTDIAHRLTDPSALGLRLARLRQLWPFVRALVAACPDVIQWRLTKDPIYRFRVKTRLGLDSVPGAGPMNDSLFTPFERDEVPTAPITILLPIYNAFDLLPDVLRRVEEHTDLPFHLILIEDRSTDERVRPFLREWITTRTDHATLIENAENLGFIRSVNRGLEMALERGHHVVLLNSDAFVPRNWASRLLRPILARDDVATVTPMSNDAEIFSVPAICTRTVLTPGEGDALDHVASRFRPDTLVADAPTGVGFCMAMNLRFLHQIPSLDTVFGRGYGEEVDWCQKARALGGTHLALPELFVEHRGGESFGTEEKRALVLQNNAMIARRYPTYDREVQSYIEADPLLTARLALAVGFVGVRATGPVPIYMAHSLGGGAEHYLQDRIRRDLGRDISSIIIRVGGPHRFQVEVRTPGGETSGATDNVDFLRQVLEPIADRHVVYSCGVGDPEPTELPDILLSLAGRAGQIEVLVHDFFPVSPSYCLLDDDGWYRGPVTSDREDRAHVFRHRTGTTVPLADWQAAWGRLMRAAGEVTVFSENSRQQILSAYPEVEEQVSVCPHTLLSPVPRLSAPVNDKTVVAVLGNIGFQKGAALVRDLSFALESEPDTDLVLIGNIDPSYALASTTPVHGDYRIEDLQSLTTRYGVTCWLIPSIWPETFSYTTHECLASGLPVFAFDIGAQGCAVAKAENGQVIRFEQGADLVQNILTEIRSKGRS
ncbi:glycosyltransferase [Nioella nitratireducens]|uniref:glycosyltransferase n=1 Tax=Nioella nitratireducens TaxID=1287720 RepID=UPI000A06995A|nr:glycosyltransferase [Nioella nitratireducens]